MKRAFAFGLIGLGFLLLLSGVGYAIFNQSITHPGSARLPQQVAGLPLSHERQGLQAVEEINRLHGKQFPLTSAAIGHYGSYGEVTLWVSGVAINLMASRILNSMRDRIAEGNSPFIPLEERTLGGRAVYVLDGMGQRHFYFRSERSIIWLAADPALAEQAIDHTLEVYP